MSQDRDSRGSRDQEVSYWTNWLAQSSRMLSLTEPPIELLTLFVVQSLRLAGRLASCLSDRTPKEVVDGHVRAYLLDRTWSYHLVVALVCRDLRKSDSRVLALDSPTLIRRCEEAVAIVMLRGSKCPAEGSGVRRMAGRVALRSLQSPSRPQVTREKGKL
jgi:hypothetical protein